MNSKIESYPPMPPNPRDNETRSPAIIHADAYKMFDAVKALKAISNMHAEFGAIERIERDIQRHANLLGINLDTLKQRYNKYAEDRELQRTVDRIEAGCYDEAVAARHVRATAAPSAPMNKHYPLHDQAQSKRNVAAVTVRNGGIQNVLFAEDHGLSDGIHALVIA